MNLFTSRYHCKNEACTFDRVLQTKYEGTKQDREFMAWTHNQTYLASRPRKLHAKKKHDVEITHWVKENIKK